MYIMFGDQCNIIQFLNFGKIKIFSKNCFITSTTAGWPHWGLPQLIYENGQTCKIWRKVDAWNFWINRRDELQDVLVRAERYGLCKKLKKISSL